MKEFLQIHPADTVAVALQDLTTGFEAKVGGQAVTLRSDIPAGHKFALRDIAEGEDVIKYGFPIGHAVQTVCKGELVDHHNLATNLSGTLDYEEVRIEQDMRSKASDQQIANDGHLSCSDSAHSHFTFEGYLRSDGQVGIRNDIWITH